MKQPLKRTLSFFVLCIIICSICISPLHAATLHDLNGHWSVNDVNKLITRGAVGGYPDGTFKPDATITRAEFSKILRQSIGLNTVSGNSFNDTVAHWALSDIQTLVDSGIIVPAEYGTNYGPDYNITRREIAIMLIRAMGLNDSAVALSGEPAGFSDEAAIKSYDKGYLYLAKELGLVGGYEDGSFRPNNKATRAEACVMIVRLLALMGIDTTIPTLPDAEAPEQNVVTPSTSQQNGYEITLKDIQRTNTNALGERYVQASMQLTIPNKTAQALTVTEANLKTTVTYSTGAQVTAMQKPFETVIAPEHTAYIDTNVHILLPDNQVANMVLGNSITNIQVQLILNGQTISFDEIGATLMQSIK